MSDRAAAVHGTHDGSRLSQLDSLLYGVIQRSDSDEESGSHACVAQSERIGSSARFFVAVAPLNDMESLSD